MKVFALSIIMLASFSIYGQKLDSLLKVLSQDVGGFERAQLYNLIAYEYLNQDSETALTYMDSALTLADKLNDVYARAYNDYVRGSYLMGNGRYDSAILCMQSAVGTLLEQDKVNDLEDVYNNIGICFKRKGDLDSANHYYKLSMNYVGDDFGRARIYVNLGSNYIAQGKLDNAAASQLRAIEIFERLGEHRGLTIAYLNLGNIHYKKEDYDWAMKYYKLSLASALVVGHKPVQSRNYLNIASIMGLNKEYDSALSFNQQAIPLLKAVRDETGLAACYRNIGEIFLETNRVDSAEIYFKRSYSLYTQLNHAEGLTRINKFLAGMYLQRGELKLAQQYVESSVRYAREAGLTHELQKALELQHVIYKRLGKYQAAYESLFEEKSIADSVFAEEKLLQVNELQTRYETEKKDQEILNLSQQAQIRELQLNQRNTQLMGAGIVLLVLVLGGVVLVQRRSFRHQQAVADMEQRFLRLQMNPHFIFNALTSIQAYMVKHSAIEASSFLGKFSRLMRQILENSREEFIPIEEEVKMLTNYLDIHQLNQAKPFQYQIEIGEDIDQEALQIPPMLVQPFVENAIEHGINQDGEIGVITVKFEKVDQYINIEITDNGGGFKATEQVKQHQSLATTIISERIDLFNQKLKDKIKLTIGEVVEHDEIKGARVQLKMPFSYI